MHECSGVLEHGEPAAEATVADEKPVVYRIHLTETSGREERLHWEFMRPATKISVLREGEPMAHRP
jgi:hypothetical protein